VAGRTRKILEEKKGLYNATRRGFHILTVKVVYKNRGSALEGKDFYKKKKGKARRMEEAA